MTITLLTEKQIELVKEVLPFLQDFANENMPDMEGVLESDEQGKINAMICYDFKIQFPLNKINKERAEHLSETLSTLSSFGYEWFPEEGLSDDEITNANSMLDLGRQLADEIKKMKIVQLYGVNGFDWYIKTNAEKDDFQRAIEYAQNNIEDYNNEDVAPALRQLGFVAEHFGIDFDFQVEWD